ncbi:hypothetical protein DFH28DRAFT_1141653 [Melampsora americana]|nr:hypothetical protein DFH28DRAFT_1141653 [Melampsora americana]
MPSPPANQTFSLDGDDIQASPRPIADDQDDQAEEADLSFTKRKRLHPQESDSEQTHPHESQGSITRKVEIKKASERYNTWKDMYDSTNSRLEAMRAAADPDDDAIMEELDNLSKDLDKYNESVKEKKTHLDELISQGCEGHVEIVVYDPANFRKRVESSTQNSPQSTRALRKRPKLIQNEQRQAALTDTNVRRKLREPKKKQESRHASDSEGTGQPPPTQSSPEPSYASLFTGADIDLTQIIKDVTRPEALYIKSFTEFLPSNQFNWGLALGSSVVNIIFCWTHAMPPPRDLGDDNSIGANIKRLTQISNHEDMTKFLKTAPRTMQMSAVDQFFQSDSINWDVLEQSMEVPWKDRNGFFKALHAMACRTDDKLQWTSEPGIQSRLKKSYSIINQILIDSVRNLSHNTPHINIKIRTTGEHAVPLDMVDIAKGIGWVHQQIMVRGNGEDGDDIKKVNKNGMEWLQRRYLLVLIGLMLIYESDVYNEKFEIYKKEKKRTQSELRTMKKKLKDSSCLNQLSQSWLQLHPERAVKGSRQSITDTEIQLQVKKLSQEDLKIKAVRDASELRSDALRALSLFLLYGTAGLFHVWPARREVLLHDSSYLINFTSVLATRYHNSAKKDKQVYYDRAWSSLDNHLMTLLSQFVSPDGKFKKDMDWPGMTVMFSQDFDTYILSPLFILDITNELYVPGRSRTPGGLEAPHVTFEGKKDLPLLTFTTKDLKDVLTVATGQDDDDEWTEKNENATKRKGKRQSR